MWLVNELAHEIKNPLSTIKINLKLISEELDDYAGSLQGGQQNGDKIGRMLRKIGVIQKETDRLEHILDGFLQYADRIEPQAANADVNELLSDMIDFYSPQCHSHSIIIRTVLCKRALVCRVDAGMLKQAILNLFINAQQAMPKGGELMIRSSVQENYAVIQIGDTGEGIEKKRLANLFEAYHSSRPEGSGLGLPTTKKIIEAHKGTISVDSETGKGTQFTIKLPLAE